MRGVRWRVGNGTEVTIWNDASLPSLEQPRIQSLVVDSRSEATVSSLFLPSSSPNWNM